MPQPRTTRRHLPRLDSSFVKPTSEDEVVSKKPKYTDAELP